MWEYKCQQQLKEPVRYTQFDINSAIEQERQRCLDIIKKRQEEWGAGCKTAIDNSSFAFFSGRYQEAMACWYAIQSDNLAPSQLPEKPKPAIEGSTLWQTALTLLHALGYNNMAVEKEFKAFDQALAAEDDQE